MILSSQEMEFLFPVLRSQPKVDTLTGHFPFLGSWFFSLSHQFTFKFPALRRGRESLLPTPFPEYTHTLCVDGTFLSSKPSVTRPTPRLLPKCP